MAGVAVPDVLEQEVTVKADKPPSKTKEQFCKRRMDVEVVLPCDVIGCEFAKVDLVEAGASSDALN